ncbi:MAG: anti-sigma factor family protein [Terriglobia bacterium]
MNCEEVIRKLNDYLDGELDSTLKQGLEKHLLQCADCDIVVDTTRKTVDLYCNCESLPLPDDVRERLNRALAKKLGLQIR